MRRLFLFFISFGLLVTLSTQNVFAGYTCCDKTGYIAPAEYGLHCDACDNSGKEWKNSTSSCAPGQPKNQCEVCSGNFGRTFGNFCDGNGSGGPTPAPVKRACGEACTTTSDCRNPSTGGYPVECRNNKCQLPLTGPYACAEGQSSGSICSCATKAACGERCGPSAGNKQCNPGSICGFLTPSNACMVNGAAQTTKQYCIPVNPANGYSIRRCDTTPAANYIAASTLVKPDGTQTGLTSADAAAACVAYCGDGIAGPGEECDQGANNGQPGTACSASCTASAVCNDTCSSDTQCNTHQVTLRCEISGTRRYCGLDAIIENGVTIEETSSRFTKAALWRVSTSPSFSGGTEIYASDNGATISFTTSADSITLVQSKTTNRGVFAVLIDGKVQPTKIDQYNATTLFKNNAPIDLRGLDSPPLACTNNTCRLVSDPTNTTCAVTPSTPTPAPKVTISSTIETDPSLTGGTPPSLIGGFLDPYCDSPSNGTRISTGSVSATDLSGKQYPGSINSSGTYTITNLPAADDSYCVKYTPSSSGVVCTCPTGCQYCGKDAPTTQNLKFYLSPVGEAWYQTMGGEVAAQSTSGNSFIDTIATTCVEPFCSPFLSVPLGNDTSSLGSLITHQSAAIDLGAGSVAKSPDTRSVRLSSPLVCTENYDYFYRLYSLGLEPTSDFALPGDAAKPNGIKDVYYYEGTTPLTIASPWEVGESNPIESLVIFVKGNLKITNTITVKPGAFLAFIVSGSIDIDPSVGTTDHASSTDGQVQGIYIANGSIRVLGVDSTGTEKKFIGEGTFAACNGIKIDRDFVRGGAGLDNNKYPASLFIYRPDFMDSTPERMKTSKYNWTEVEP
jgi:hypothetical protein